MPDKLVADLLAKGFFKQLELERAVELAAESDRSVLELLADTGVVEERELYSFAAAKLGVDFADVGDLLADIDMNVVRSVPRPYQERKRIIPICRNAGRLTVGSSCPDPRTLDLADALACDQVDLRLLTPTDFRRMRWAIDLGQLPGAPTDPGDRVQADLLSHDITLEPEHVALLQSILVDAVGERASDVHLERYGDRVRVRLRVDGELYDVNHYRLTTAQLLGIVNVLKVQTRLNIAENRRPQGGRMDVRIAGHQFDLRVQVQPTLHGEHAIVRLLPQDRDLFSIDTIGFTRELTDIYRRTLRTPSGLVLVVGPTGCGKSTTLYAGLQVLAHDPTRKVITVEDPIEYSIEGVQQTQVNPDVQFTFANAVRSFVRQDPDVILVGEIRDEETALEALRASQTGHLVFATLHSADAVGAVQRLFDLGMHPNSIAAELSAIFAQRLAKRICPACREATQPDPALIAEVFGGKAPEGFQAFRGAGCERCHGRGTLGRVAIGEYLPSTRELRLAISHERALDELRTTATQAGLRPMRESALELATSGVIAFADLPTLFPLERLREAEPGDS